MKTLWIILFILLFSLPLCTLAEDAIQTETASREIFSEELEHTLENLGFEYEITGDSVTVTEYTGGAETLKIPDGVTKIGDGAFFFCEDPFGEKDSLKSVTLPESVMEIGSQAFIACSDLKEFCVSPGNTHFKSIDGSLFTADGKTLIHVPGGRKLTEYIVPDGVTEIGDFAFCNCSDLRSVRLPNGIRSIGDHAFGDCAELNSLELPDSLTQIGDFAFVNCSFRSLTLPENVTHLGERLFWNCERLMEICVSPGNTHFKSIDGILFTADGKILIHVPGGRKLVEYIVPDGVTKIGDFAFEDCTNLTTVILPQNVMAISGSPFPLCQALREIRVSPKNTRIKSLDGVLFTADGTTLIQFPNGKDLTSYSVPDGVTKIANGAFHGCASLRSISLPDSLVSIGDSAFAACYHLTSLHIPDSVTEIGLNAFCWCENLTLFGSPDSFAEEYANEYELKFQEIAQLDENSRATLEAELKKLGFEYEIHGDRVTVTGYLGGAEDLTIPDGVTKIGDSAFLGCESLTSVTFPESVTEIGDSAFQGCGNLRTVTLPENVLTVGDGAFAFCWKLTEIRVSAKNTNFMDRDGILFTADGKMLVQFPNGKPQTEYTVSENVTRIGAHAFAGSGNLKSVLLPASVSEIGPHAFSGCACLEFVKFTASVMKIGPFTFANCVRLQHIQLPNGVKSVEEGLFFNCENLLSVTFPMCAETVCKNAFYGCENLKSVTFPDTMKTIETETFDRCTRLQTATIPSCETEIGAKVFYDCDDLTIRARAGSKAAKYAKENGFPFEELTAAEKIAREKLETALKEQKFQYETTDDHISITNYTGDAEILVIPDGVTDLRARAFFVCKSLTSVEIPESVMWIDERAFTFCENLTEIRVSPKNTHFKSIDGVLFTADGKTLIQYPRGKQLTEYTVPDGVTKIGSLAFESCGDLRSVTLPNTITSIGRSAFEDCWRLRNMRIPARVTEIGEDAFGWGTSLTLHGKAGSKAEEYAKENALRFQAVE